jgi:hypothetical protein
MKPTLEDIKAAINIGNAKGHNQESKAAIPICRELRSPTTPPFILAQPFSKVEPVEKEKK